jgi:hypothetical protein
MSEKRNPEPIIGMYQLTAALCFATLLLSESFCAAAGRYSVMIGPQPSLESSPYEIYVRIDTFVRCPSCERALALRAVKLRSLPMYSVSMSSKVSELSLSDEEDGSTGLTGLRALLPALEG